MRRALAKRCRSSEPFARPGDVPPEAHVDLCQRRCQTSAHDSGKDRLPSITRRQPTGKRLLPAKTCCQAVEKINSADRQAVSLAADDLPQHARSVWRHVAMAHMRRSRAMPSDHYELQAYPPRSASTR